MAGITLEQAEAQLALWIEADMRVSKKQEYTIAGRTWRAADAAEISNKAVVHASLTSILASIAAKPAALMAEIEQGDEVRTRLSRELEEAEAAVAAPAAGAAAKA